MSSPARVRRNQPRSTSAMWRTSPRSDSVEGSADRMRSWFGSSPAHFRARVSRCHSRKASSVDRSSSLRGMSSYSITVLRDGHPVVEVDVLDRVEQMHAVAHRPLECLAPADQPGAAGALVDHGGANRRGEITRADRLTAGVDQADASRIAVEHLVAAEVDRMIGTQLGVDALGSLAEVERRVAAVGGRQLLLDDVRLDGHAKVVGLAGEVRGDRIVDPVLLESGVAQVAPEDRRHPELVRLGERHGDLLELTISLVGTEVDRGSDRDRAEVPGLLDRAEHDLVELVRVGEQLVVVELDDELDAM